MLSALAVGVVFAFNAIPALAALTSISGYAYGESFAIREADGLTAGLPFPTAGPFNQSSNFSASNSAASVTFPGLLTTGLLQVATTGTVGPTGAVHSTATVASVNALSGTLTADHVSAQCAVDSNGNTSGSSTLTNAVLAGVGALAVNPGPNTVVAFSTLAASGTVTLNEQTYDPATNTLTVNAIHIRVTGGTLLGSATSIDIIIAHVECDATPGGAHPVIPEAPIALLLPLTALAVFGGAIFLSTRRGPATLRLGR